MLLFIGWPLAPVWPVETNQEKCLLESWDARRLESFENLNVPDLFVFEIAGFLTFLLPSFPVLDLAMGSTGSTR